MDTFGEVIRKERRAKAWTLKRVGKRVGLSKGGLSGVERGVVNPPSAGVVRKLAKLYGLDVTEMMRMAWQPKVPKEIRHLLEVKDASKDRPIPDTPISTEAATAVFKEVFNPKTISFSQLNDPADFTTTEDAGSIPLSDGDVSV